MKVGNGAFLITIIVTSVTCSSLASEVADPCEKYIYFTNPGDSSAVHFEDPFMKNAVDRNDLVYCPIQKKQAMCDIFCKIYKRAPGLLERASNGQRLRLILSRTCDSERFAEAGPGWIKCHADMSFGAESYVIIMHELVHAVDGYSLSTSLEWNKLVGPCMQRFRAKYRMASEPFLGTVDPSASLFGLPSSYAASNSEEALAECTTAIVIANWESSSGINSFIEKHILSKPEAIDRERELVAELDRNMTSSNFQKSIGLATQILRLNSNSAPAWADLSIIWDNLDEPELAEFHARKGLQILELNRVPAYDPLSKLCRAEPAVAYADYSNHFRELGRYQQAVASCERAIELDPNCAAAYGNRGLAYAYMNQYRKSISDYNRAITLAPKEAWTYFNRGNAYENLHNYKKAIDDYNRAIHLNPYFSQAYSRRSTALKKLGHRGS